MSAPVAEKPAAPPPAAKPEHESFWRTTTLPSLLSIVMALVVGAVLIALSDDDVRAASQYFFGRPTDTVVAIWQSVVQAYGALFRGSIINLSGDSVASVLGPMANTLLFATPLIAGGLAVAIPFRAGMFNIGTEGQITIAAVFAAYVGFAVDLPPVVHLLAAVLAGLLGGALWGSIPGVLKATTGAHEVITTIMLNYVARFGILFALGTTYFQREGRSDPISPTIADTATLPALLPFGRLNAALLIALAAAAVAWWLINRSTVGFRLRAVGANPEAARTAGMSVPRTYITAMVLAGTFAGVAGVSQVLGSERVLTTGISAGLGFDAITVALLGRANPIGVVAAGVLFGGLKAGGLTMQATTGTSLDIVVVLQALIVLFIAAPALISAVFRLKSTGAGVGQLSKGWNG